MGLRSLDETALKLIMFGGKGGVGKTTSAVSCALFLAGNRQKTLLISTDPAHSVADSLDQQLGSQIMPVTDTENLSALQINADKALVKFKTDYEDEIKTILETATNLDEEDIRSVFDTSVPGLDEVMSFKTIIDLIEEKQFDKYIVDTAPTGHALRLITLPSLFDDWIKVMARMRWKYRYMVKRFSGRDREDLSDDFLVGMKKTVKRIEELLRDQSRCEFIPVTIPEEMAIAETERLVKSLEDYGIWIKQLIINNVLVLTHDSCQFCRKRSENQQIYIDLIREKFSRLNIVIVPLQAGEVRQKEALEKFKEFLFA